MMTVEYERLTWNVLDPKHIEILAKAAGTSSESMTKAITELLTEGGPSVICCLLRRLQEVRMDMATLIKDKERC